MKNTLWHWSLSALALGITACAEGPDPAPPPQDAGSEVAQSTEFDVARAFETLRDAGEGRDEGRGGLPRFFVVPRDVPLFGRSITDWTAEMWRWGLSVPAPENPALAFDQACSFGQDDPIFYLPPFQGLTYERACDARFGRLVLFSVGSILNDYPCPDPAFEPPPGQSLEQFLTEGAKAVTDGLKDVHVTVDGVTVDHLQHRHTTGLFEFTGHPSLAPTVDSCITGSPQPGVSDGWWFVLAFAPGEHTLRMTATTSSGRQLDKTIRLNVELF